MLFYFAYPSLFFLFAVDFTMILRHGLRSWRHSENGISAGPPKSENKGLQVKNLIDFGGTSLCRLPAACRHGISD